MKASNQLLDAIRGFESCKLKAYKCPAGVWTIGYGSTQNVYSGLVITYAEAEKRLQKDLSVYEAFVNKIPEINTQGKFDAVVDFCFNCGIANFKSSTLYKYIQQHKPVEDIINQFKRWDKATKKYKDPKTGKMVSEKVTLPGLTKRRAWEAMRWQQAI